ncbi:hypothetical protein SA2016_0089 [Sinomonas atrocyanea]|uniref:DUF1918 domain-containing protein n=1 Tax=Sinomonas atrocyanea TaxID=37927 RepID=A0A126ZW65_9MICC|nr:hypothetical protein [Sinomonas atrocyanea]AMM30794.1 hypothetical protein SA2016_0089 [Sinomonas atrocyanea]GEB63840.1 hypothetical protein SAT01_12880 [Sinomonas atrocyanea]GGG65244.1 hypothetical protein GCM10007172_15910 [Sinomonas atrocyanea]
MIEQTSPPQPARRRHCHWTPNAGDRIELRTGGTTIHAGRVETVMPDQSGFWIAPDGVNQRRYILIGDDSFEIWA